jgi:hypothetical protein
MNAHIRVLILSALLFAGVLTVFQAFGATTSVTATATATVISPTNVARDATAELLKKDASGVFTLRMPSAFCISSNRCDQEAREMTLSSIWVQGTTIVIAISDSAPPFARVLALATSGGGMNNILSSGLGVNLVITNVEEDGAGRGKLYAIIVYN